MPSTRAGWRNSVPPGKRCCGSCAKRSKRSALPLGGLGDQLAGEGGERQALAGIALGEEDIAGQPAEMRQAAHGDGELPAPGIVDALARELGKDLQHMGPHEARDVARAALRE